MDQSAVGQFNARNGRDGLFLHYARNRTHEFWTRQSITLLGAAAIAAFGSVQLSIAVGLVALAGEILDCAVLIRINHRYRGGTVPIAARRLALLTAVFQAVTISVCISICWRGINLVEAQFFAATFLMSAVINAGLVRRQFREGASAKLAIYVLTIAWLVSGDLAAMQLDTMATAGFFLGSLAIMAYTATLFIMALENGHGHRLRFEQALLAEQLALNQSRQALAIAGQRAERLALVAQHASDSVIITDRIGRIEWVNAAFSTITGYSHAEAVGQFPGDILNGPDTSPEALAILIAAQRNGVPCRVEIQNRTKGGALVWMEISMTPVLGTDGVPQVFVAVERDVTQSKADAAELARAQQSAEAAAASKSQFLATMSHEIRTPMNGVIGVAELLGDTGLDDQQQHYVKTIIESGHALLTIINDVLDLSKLQAGKADLLSQPFQIADCVAGSLDLLRPIAQKKGLAMKLHLPDDCPTYLGDSGRVRQVLLNLIGNAVKFTALGKVSVAVSVQAAGECDQISIAVADTGIGIPAHQIGHVFDSFAQADNSISRQFGGTGLGLSISRCLVQQMGGDIEATSVPGQGSVFTARLRLKRAKTALNAWHTRPAAAPKTALRVLIAEDNRTNLMIARKFLSGSVAKLFEAVNGRLAVQAYRDTQPDLVLMDVSMPELNGQDASRAIRTHEKQAGLPRCPIFALTAYSAADEEARCLAAGMDGVLTKPLVRRELYTLLERIAASRDRFDERPHDGVDRAANGEQTWSILPPGSTTTTGKLIRSSGL